ncbi:MAG: CDP-alcohol phosphatidyltransferase family protein [Patescibacteria group bacterium]|jgi:CDP-diacylglycerol--glycerol-3-phosphate 3-phosphatidyltransferase
MTEAETKIKLHPHDWLLKYTILLLIPYAIKPNHFTYLRLALTPLVLYLVTISNYYWALIAFVLVALTDAIDGSLARTRNQITELGKILDPVADKFLIASTVFVLMLKHINVFISLAIIAMEAAFLLGWYINKRKGREVRVNVWGKLKMDLQVIGVAILLLGLTINKPLMFRYSEGTLFFAIIFAGLSLFAAERTI